MCVITTRCPTLDASRPAMEKLDGIHSALQKIAGQNSTARKNLVRRILAVIFDAVKSNASLICQVLTRRLRNLARAAFDRSKFGSHSMPVPSEDVEMLHRGCGKSHVRTRRDRNRDAARRHRRREAAHALSSEQQSESWSERSAKTGGASFPSEATSSSSSNVSDEFMRYGLSGDNFGSPFVQGLDSSWNTFIQSLGF